MMMINGRCGLRCSRLLVLVFNTVFCVMGLFVSCVGLWCLTGPGWDVLQALAPPSPTAINEADFQALYFSPSLQQLAFGLLAVGLGVVMTSALGCWAAVKESRCGLGLYLLLVLLLVLGQVLLGGLAVLYQARAVSGLAGLLRARMLAHYSLARHERFTNAMDYVQFQLQCCGVLNASDWQSSRWLRDGHGGRYRAGQQRLVPLTCCRLVEVPQRQAAARHQFYGTSESMEGRNGATGLLGDRLGDRGPLEDRHGRRGPLEDRYGVLDSSQNNVSSRSSKRNDAGVSGVNSHDTSESNLHNIAGINFNTSGTIQLGADGSNLQRPRGGADPLGAGITNRHRSLRSVHVHRASDSPHLNPVPLNEAQCQSSSHQQHAGMRHQTGCLERVKQWVRAESGLIVGCGVGVGLLQIAGLIAAITLCRATKKRGVP